MKLVGWVFVSSRTDCIAARAYAQYGIVLEMVAPEPFDNGGEALLERHPIAQSLVPIRIETCLQQILEFRQVSKN